MYFSVDMMMIVRFGRLTHTVECNRLVIVRY